MGGNEEKIAEILERLRKHHAEFEAFVLEYQAENPWALPYPLPVGYEPRRQRDRRPVADDTERRIEDLEEWAVRRETGPNSRALGPLRRIMERVAKRMGTAELQAETMAVLGERE
jgi:hypothetical protein